MPTLPIVHSIVSLKKLAVFRDYVATEDVPAFRRHNLIYGFNGSGKTTLARVFACLQAGSLLPALPEGGLFELKLTDGTDIKSTGSLHALKGRLLVFNVDFIEENLRWKDGTAKAIRPEPWMGRAAKIEAALEESE